MNDAILRGRDGLKIPVAELGEILPIVNARINALSREQRDEDVDELVAKGLEEVP